MDKPGISGVLLEVEDSRGFETSIAMMGDVGSGFTPATPVTKFTSLVSEGVGGFAGVMGRDDRNDLAVGLRGKSSGFADMVGVLSESLISPSSLEEESTVDGGRGGDFVLVCCTGGLGGAVVGSLLP